MRDLPARLRDHPGLTGLAGASSAVLAVPEPALAYVVAGLSHLSRRHPLVVAVPTTPQAERLVHDLEAFLGAGEVDLFPAWETLPFERVSPSVETMGRRLRAMWRLKDPKRSPRVLVAPVRSLMQRLGPHVEEVEPVTIGPGGRLDPVDLVERLVAAGYRREVQVEHRGQVARRGSIVDVFPSTADAPVRIDLWGDEVDRLTGFSVGDQRSTHDLACVELFPSRELLPTDEVRARAAELVGVEPWGREQWERLAEGAVFEGMESWLPWLTGGEHVLFDLLGPDALVLLAEPRRMRDRGADLMAEEASLADSLATTWGAAHIGLRYIGEVRVAPPPPSLRPPSGPHQGPGLDRHVDSRGPRRHRHRGAGLGPGDGRRRPAGPAGRRPGDPRLRSRGRRRRQGLGRSPGRPAVRGRGIASGHQ